MPKDVGKAAAPLNKADAAAGAKRIASNSLSVGFKKQFTLPEQREIDVKRRELRERLAAAG